MTSIVIVDDDAGDLAILQRAFSTQAMTSSVIAHQSAEDALAWMDSSTTIDLRETLVITDLNMPRVDGFEFIRRLRARPEPPPVIVVLSTSARASEIERAYREGANAYHTKPMGYVETAELVRGIMHYWANTAHLPHASPVVRSLLYASSATRQIGATELEDLEVRAQIINASHGVTGFLIHHEGRFVQYLEGEAAGLEAIYRRISNDDRHRIDHNLGLGTGRRRFPEWSMVGVDLTMADEPQLASLISQTLEAFAFGDDDPRTAHTVKKLTRRMANLHLSHTL